jgi:glycolate oxidase iron-sulfur subunit
MNSSGCGAFMKEYGHLLKDDPRLSGKAAGLSAKTLDLTEFLVATGFQPAQVPSSAIAGKTVTYHDACHLVHSQRISAQPRELIRATRGITFRELPESTWCCGSAGIYNITRHEDSLMFLERKVRNIVSVDPAIVVTGNPGCMIQISHGLRKEGRDVTLMHTATFLRHACAI